jgi:1,4-alpha-glucan branching enzyme
MYKNSVPAGGSLHRYSAHRNTKPVNFVCVAPEAKSVQLIGDFNHWSDSGDHPMKRRPDGAWFAEISLRHGHHRYVFLVDGERVLDPKAMGVGRDEQDQRVSLLSVS